MKPSTWCPKVRHEVLETPCARPPALQELVRRVFALQQSLGPRTQHPEAWGRRQVLTRDPAHQCASRSAAHDASREVKEDTSGWLRSPDPPAQQQRRRGVVFLRWSLSGGGGGAPSLQLPPPGAIRRACPDRAAVRRGASASAAAEEEPAGGRASAARRRQRRRWSVRGRNRAADRPHAPGEPDAAARVRARAARPPAADR